MGRTSNAAIILLMAISAGGCASGRTAPAPGSVLTQSGAALAQLQGATVDMRITGDFTVAGYAIVSATGMVKPPDQGDFSIKARFGEGLFTVRLVSYGGETWLQAPFSALTKLTGPDEPVPPLTRLFDPAHGLPMLLGRGSSPRYDGLEQVDGVDCDRVSATYTQADVAAVFAPLTPAGPVSLTVWSGTTDHLARRFVITGRLSDPQHDVTVDVHLSRLNQPVTIQKPA
ncbi:MAG: LppX_LprAFG lipoprotein [Candidatus Dormibacteria bacterium]